MCQNPVPYEGEEPLGRGTRREVGFLAGRVRREDQRWNRLVVLDADQHVALDDQEAAVVGNHVEECPILNLEQIRWGVQPGDLEMETDESPHRMVLEVVPSERDLEVVASSAQSDALPGVRFHLGVHRLELGVGDDTIAVAIQGHDLVEVVDLELDAAAEGRVVAMYEDVALARAMRVGGSGKHDHQSGGE